MKKTFASRILAVLMVFCLIAQFAPASVAAEGDPGELYTFAETPGSATIATNGWELNFEETSPGFCLNRNNTNWFDNKTDHTLIQFNTENARDRFGLNLNVDVAGNYTVAIKSLNAPQSYNVYVNGASVGAIAQTELNVTTTHDMNGEVYFKKGINTLVIEAPNGGNLKLGQITLTWSSEAAAQSVTLNFGAGTSVVTDISRATFAKQGIRFSFDLSYGLFAGHTKWKNTDYASVGFNERVGTFAGFDFVADAAGEYDILVATRERYDHGAVVEAIVNGTNEMAANGTSIGSFKTAPAQTRIPNLDTRGVHFAGTATLNEGYNTLHFKSLAGGKGSMLLYFSEGLSLVNPTAAATVAGSTMSFTKGTAVNVTAKAPEHGLYYLYIKGKIADNGFGGNVVAGGLTQYMDFSSEVYGETAGTEVTRVFGPIWMNENANVSVAFTETYSDTSALEVSGIELHEVKQNLWMVDTANENYSKNYNDVTLENSGWELSDRSNAMQYKMMKLGSQMLSGTRQMFYYNAHRDANATNINLQQGQVKFDFNIPVSGYYAVSGVFQNINLANNIDFVIEDTDLRTRLSLYQESDSEFKTSDIGVVYLEEGTHTFIVAGGEEVVPDFSKYVYMKSLTFEPYTGQVADSAAVSVKETEIKVGETTQASVSIKAGEEAYTKNDYTVTYKSSNEKVVTVDAQGIVTAEGAGTADITATVAVQGRKITTDKVTVTVTSVASMSGNATAESDFGTAYAYIEDEFNGTYKVTFVGGVDKLEGFAAIGYEIRVDGGETVDVDSNKVYESIKLSDEEIYTADTYGGNFIFIGAQDGITAGQTVTARPYVKDAEGNKTYHGEVVLTLKF